MENERRENRPAINWQEVKIIENAEEKIAVLINRSNRIEGVTPIYSIRLVKLVDVEPDDKDFHTRRTVPFIRVYRDRTVLPHAKLSNPFADAVGELMKEAEQFIELDMNVFVQEDLDFKRENEEELSNRGKPVTRHTGKTEQTRLKKSAGNASIKR